MPSLALRLSAALACIACAMPAFAAMQAKPVEWSVGKDRYSGYVVYDDASRAKRPGLVMVPNWMGVTPAAVEKAKSVAGRDYVVLVADVYGKGMRPDGPASAGKLAGSLRGEDRTALRARVDAALAALREQAGKVPLDAGRIGAFGFCFGGSAVLELARSGARLAGVVSLHGGLAPGARTATATKMATPVMVLNGAADKAVPASDKAAFQSEMDKAGADWQFVDFSGAVHCFAEADAGNTPGSNCRYDARAAKRAYRMLHAFFRERFAAGG